MAIQYLSEAWGEAALQRLREDDDVQRALARVDVSLLSIIRDAPEGCFRFIYARFADGVLSDYRVGHDFASVQDVPKPTFTVSGDYTTFAACQNGDLSEKRAVLTGRLHLTGGLTRALRYWHALEALTECLRAIECDTEPPVTA